jgi:hypothetical protein
MKYRLYTYDEPITIPHKTIVCPRCDGSGSHDCWEGGMTGDEMAEQGPEFFEDYMSGVYSVPCSECKGRNVIQVPDRDRIDPELLAEIDQQEQDEADYQAMVAAERRMGC